MKRKDKPTASPTFTPPFTGVGDDVGFGPDVVTLCGAAEVENVILGATVMFIEGATVMFIEGATVMFIEGATVMFIEGATVMFIEGATVMFIEGATVTLLELDAVNADSTELVVVADTVVNPHTASKSSRDFILSFPCRV